MRAAVYKGDRKMVVEEVPDPEPGSEEILIKMKYCGICGSDVHAYEYPETPSNCIMGHEWVGEVAALGQGVSSWQVGDRVWPGGSNKFPNYSWKPEYGWDMQILLEDDPVKDMGGYGEYACYYKGALAHVPEEVSDIEACMADQAATALGAIHTSGFQIGETVLIIGAGPIGLWTLRCAQLAGARKVGVAELADGRRKVADRMGADKVLDPNRVDVREQVTDFFDGIGPDVIVECAGTQSALQLAIEVAKPDGKIALVGISMDPIEINTFKMYIKGVEMRSVLHIDFPGGMELLRKKKVDYRDFLTEVISLENVPKAFETLLSPIDQVKIIVGY
jgi:2-desacetyl-2-hydroxyethyl bacteriochlorophyllide A dehydrogenase